MSHPLKRRPSPAMVVSLLALFVALGGSSYAAFRVGSAQIADNSVRSRDIRNNDVRGKDVRDGTLTGVDVARDRLTGADILESSLRTVPDSLKLGGLPASSYLSTSKFVTSGGAKKLAKGQTTTLFKSGPFTVTASCEDAGATGSRVTIDVTSSEASSSLNGTEGTTRNVDTTTASGYAANVNQSVDLAAPSGATLDFVLQDGVNGLGVDCWAAGFGFS